MPRAARVVAAGAPHHVTRWGNHQENVFSSAQDRRVYLALLREQCEKAELAVVGFCLMSNHIHLVVVPAHGLAGGGARTGGAMVAFGHFLTPEPEDLRRRGAGR